MGVVSQLPKGGQESFLGRNNIKNEFSTIKLLKVEIFTQIQRRWNLNPNTNGRGQPNLFVVQNNLKNEISNIKLRRVQIF